MKRLICLVAIVAALSPVGFAWAGDDPVEGGSDNNQIWVKLRHHTVSTSSSRRVRNVPPATHSRVGDESSTQPHQLPYFAYSLVIGGQTFCAGGRALVACSPGTAPPVPPATVSQPQVTPGAVLTAIRRVGLPALTARTQPEGKTLVNFATIFYTQPRPFSRTVSLLGRQVQVMATPASYTWHYGDGTSTTTKRPGAPYPAKDVTHNYTDAHTTVQTSVDVTYSGRFRVGNGDWLSIPGSVTIAGPSTPLRVSEATAVLSGNYE
jgi:hypothetical protein